MSKYKKQHYLSEFYINGFASKSIFSNYTCKDLYQVWIYDIENKTIKCKSPDNIAWEPYYYSQILKNGEYDHKLEKSLSKLENKVSKVIEKVNANIKRIRNNKSIIQMNDEDRFVIIEFIFWNMKKVPSIIDKLHNDIHASFIEISNKFQSEFKPAEVKNKTIELICNLGKNYGYDFVDVLNKKNFRFIYLRNDKSCFVTTDNPVVRLNKTDSDGIGLDSTEIYFPLTQRCLIFLHQIGNKYEFVGYSDRKYLLKHNIYMASKATKMIISRDKEYLIKIVDNLGYEIINMDK